MEISNDKISWLNSNDTDEYKELVVVPKNATNEQRLALLSKSLLTAIRRRELIDSFANQFGLLNDIPLAIEMIGHWQAIIGNRKG